jgi:hypothetical protein
MAVIVMIDLSVDTLRDGIESARSISRLDELSRLVWKGVAENALDDVAAQTLSDLLDARRIALRGRQAAPSRRLDLGSIFPPKRPQRSPDRARSLERRRTLAASGPLPPALASHFTTGELAALKIIGDEMKTRGVCDLHVDEIAARAGVSPSTMRNARRTAEQLGYISVEERRRRGQRNLSNRIVIVDPSWRAWIAPKPKENRSGGEPARGGGFKSLRATDRQISSNEIRRVQNRPKQGYRAPRMALSDPPATRSVEDRR